MAVASVAIFHSRQQSSSSSSNRFIEHDVSRPFSSSNLHRRVAREHSHSLIEGNILLKDAPPPSGAKIPPAGAGLGVPPNSTRAQ